MIKLYGFQKVSAKINKEIKKIKGHSMDGLIDASITIRRDMDISIPMIPVDLGNLRASWFVSTAKGNKAKNTNPSFKGPKAGEIKSDYSAAVNAGISKAKSIKNPFVVMGFGANYALAVHERADNPNWKKEGSGPWFFQASLEKNKKAILKSIANKAKIK